MCLLYQLIQSNAQDMIDCSLGQPMLLQLLLNASTYQCANQPDQAHCIQDVTMPTIEKINGFTSFVEGGVRLLQTSSRSRRDFGIVEFVAQNFNDGVLAYSRSRS